MLITDVVVRSNDNVLQSLISEGLVKYAGAVEVCGVVLELYEGRRYHIFSLEDPMDPYPEENTGVYVPKTVGKSLAPKIALFALWFADTDYWRIDYDSYGQSWQVDEAKENYNYITKCTSRYGFKGRIVGQEPRENAVMVRVWW